MPDLKAEVKSILVHHEGPAKPIKSNELCRIFQIKDDRKIRLVIRDLRKEVPILSSGKGYYMAGSWKEVKVWDEGMMKRLREDAITRRDTINAARRYLPPEQLELIS